MWISDPGCANLVKDSWGTSFTSYPMYGLNQKLKHLKNTLKIWNKHTFGNVHDHVKSATDKGNIIQEEIDSHGTYDDLLIQEKLAQVRLEQALDIEEIFWQQKSKVQG
jgi:hypothetical protein